MKIIASLLFLFGINILAAQSGQVALDWTASNIKSIGTTSFKVPTFKENYSYNGERVLWSKIIPLNRASANYTVDISQLKTEVITTATLQDLDKKNVASSFSGSVVSTLSRKRNYAIIQVTPIYKDGNAIRRVLSFSYKLNRNPENVTQSVAKNTNFRSSVLASGEWRRFRVDRTGVHRITRGFLENLGFNLNGIDPRQIKIYSHGGTSLPLINSETIDYDPPEIAITVTGEADGSFDNSDQILFYGIATNTQYVQENDSFINPYTDESYYYITLTGNVGKRILPFTQPAAAPSTTIDYYYALQHHEEDERNIAQLGRIWYGERFNFEPEQSFDFSFNNVIASRPSRLIVTTGAIADIPTTMDISLNGNAVGTAGYAGLAASNVVVSARSSRTFTNLNINNDDVTVTLNYNNNGDPSGTGYLDYISLEVPQQLTGIDRQFSFRNRDVATLSGVVQYNITNAAGISQIWNITDPFNVSRINTAGAATFSFNDTAGEVKEYIALDTGDLYSLIDISNNRVANQNLKGTILTDSSGNFQDLDYLIIAPQFLENEAQRLANFHITNSNLVTKVITLDEIYTEFSEGKQDIAAIRNFVKYIYDNASAPSNRIQFLNMFGDCSYDYKDRISIRENIVPSFLSRSPTNAVASYVTDDFFTYMDPREGSVGSGNLMDLAVGRMIVSDVQEAREMVDKVISYESLPAYGAWRNQVTLIGDDVDENSDIRLQEDVNNLADEIALNRPELNVEKIILDSYNQVSGAGGQRYPQAQQDIINAFEQGSLVVNYFGHGNEDGLAREFVITQSTVENLRNPNTLPLFITVTCEFTRYDNPLRVSGGELTYLNPQGGAISLVATNRLILITDGASFNTTLDRYLFSYDNVEPVSMAEALRLAKVELGNDDQRRVIAYIGDPALKLAFPKPRAVITQVNGLPIDNNLPVLQGLERVTMTGEIQGLTGDKLTDYNGTLTATIFDKKVERTTLANDNFVNNNNQLVVLQFDELGETLFKGQASITNGDFQFEYIMPRDTQIPVDTGRISLYAQRENELEDQNGFNLDVRMGGINTNAPADNIGPEISLFMNDTNFVNGGATDNNPFLLALVNDVSGMNTSSGVGHDITAVLDGDEVNPFILNDYYEANVDDFTSGKVFFPLRDIEPGLHTVTFKIWDTYNNSNTQEIQFVVLEDGDIILERVLNYPNPFTSYTEFWFNHNRPFEPLDVQVQVMTITGKIVWTTNQTVTTTGFTSREITWDGRDDFGQRLGKGVYVYKITAKSTLSNETASKIEKLVIL